MIYTSILGTILTFLYYKCNNNDDNDEYSYT